MERPLVYYNSQEYIETETGNKVSRKSTIYGSQNIVLGGKTIIKDGCILRGDLSRSSPSVAIAIGKYCIIEESAQIIPPERTIKGLKSHYPIRIGDCVHIGEKSIIEAASIGSFVYIGKNVHIKGFAIIKDGAVICDNSVVVGHTVIPSFSIFEGVPAREAGDLPESFIDTFTSEMKEMYYKFQLNK